MDKTRDCGSRNRGSNPLEGAKKRHILWRFY